jgi:hypothetical protein
MEIFCDVCNRKVEDGEVFITGMASVVTIDYGTDNLIVVNPKSAAVLHPECMKVGSTKADREMV